MLWTLLAVAYCVGVVVGLVWLWAWRGRVRAAVFEDVWRSRYFDMLTADTQARRVPGGHDGPA